MSWQAVRLSGLMRTTETNVCHGTLEFSFALSRLSPSLTVKQHYIMIVSQGLHYSWEEERADLSHRAGCWLKKGQMHAGALLLPKLPV